MKGRKIWVVDDSDGYETNIVAITEKKEVAEKIAEKLNAAYYEFGAKLYNSFEDFDENIQAEVLEHALEKLSDREKEILRRYFVEGK